MNYILLYPNSALIYVGILVIAWVFARFALKKDGKLAVFFIVLLILMLSLLSGLRGITVGTDTSSYMGAIQRWNRGYIGGTARDFEPGLFLLSKIILFFVDSPQFVLFAIALITNSLIISRLWSMKRYIAFPSSVFVYICLYYIMTFSGIRQWLSVAIIFYGTSFVFSQKYFKFLLVVFIATLFHNSAVVALAYIPIDLFISRREGLKQKKLLSIALFLSPVFIVGISFLIFEFGLISQYYSMLNEDNARFSIGFSLFAKLGLMLLILTFRNRKNDDIKVKTLNKKVSMVYFWGLIISFMGYLYANTARIAWYFILYEVVFYASIKAKRELSVILKFMVFALVLYIFYTNLKGSGNGQMPYIPYYKLLR